MTGWLKRTFYRRLAVAFSLTAVAAVVSTSYLVGKHYQETLIAELAGSLTTTAAVAQAQTDKALFVRRDSARLHALSQFLSEAAQARVSFIATDGAVLGDSAVPLASLGTLENHLDRPEVSAALSLHPTANVRNSHTTHQDSLYVAVPAIADGKVVGVVRAALSLDNIKKRVDRIRQRAVFLSVIVVLLSFLAALALASSLSRPVRVMSSVAERLARGEYGSRVPDAGPDEHGRLAEVLNTLAERVQRTVQELSREKTQLTAILSNMTEAVVAVDAGGRIIAVNPALVRVFNLEAEGLGGKQFLEVLRHHQLDELVRAVMAEKKGRMDEVRTFVPDERIFEAHVVPLNEGGAFTGVLVVLHDITRLRRLEQVRRDFVANVSHELRTPLASIKGFAETLEMGALNDPKNAESFVKSIQSQADRMTALVEDLLDLTAIESGQRAPARESLAVLDLISDVATGLSPLARRKNVDIRVEPAPGLPPVEIDRNQGRQIFVNLLENAVKFNREGGTVTVSAAAEAAHVAVRIADTGVGIPSQDLGRIFERFYRVDKARSRELGGTGLGLSIVKHLVESHGGELSVESSVGKGSTFTVRFPLHPAA